MNSSRRGRTWRDSSSTCCNCGASTDRRSRALTGASVGGWGAGPGLPPPVDGAVDWPALLAAGADAEGLTDGWCGTVIVGWRGAAEDRPVACLSAPVRNGTREYTTSDRAATTIRVMQDTATLARRVRSVNA